MLLNATLFLSGMPTAGSKTIKEIDEAKEREDLENT